MLQGIKWTYIQYTYAAQSVILKYLYTKHFLSFQLFYADGKISLFALKFSIFEVIFSMRLDVRKSIYLVKSTLSILHSDLNANALPPLEKNSKGH